MRMTKKGMRKTKVQNDFNILNSPLRLHTIPDEKAGHLEP